MVLEETNSSNCVVCHRLPDIPPRVPLAWHDQFTQVPLAWHDQFTQVPLAWHEQFAQVPLAWYEQFAQVPLAGNLQGLGPWADTRLFTNTRLPRV